ncbi:MAG: LytTR family DNA-binding domain-containing protein [Eubacterium sp.]|nr:LytTR family DNA-binding domain-containing protein [Eubacterium sp.]
MLRIALCDDESYARDALRIQLEKLLIEDVEDIVYEFSSGTNAVSWFQKHPGEIDLLFLDIEMRGLSGMETAAKIRQFDQNLILVFVTGYSDYVFDGYQVNALDYLLKPVSVPKLAGLLKRVRAKLHTEDEQSFLLKNMDGTWRFRFRDILYFYSDRRRVILAARSGEYPFYAKLDVVEAQLAPYFIRIHQRYLVNPANVDQIGKESVTIGTTKLPCSRKYRETAVSKIARAMMGGTLS